MAAYVGPDSWAWLAQAHQYVRAHQVNVLKPETGQDSRGAAANLRAYRGAGFRVEVMVIAVPAAMSNQGIISRYYEQVLDRGHGRLTVQADADRAYTGILDLAGAIDSERLAGEAGVFRRGEAAPRFSNALDAAGLWRATPALHASIETERARAWTAEETADFLRTHYMLRSELGAQWAQRLDEILGQAQPLMDQALETASERSVGDDLRQALEAARAASAAASARQARQRRQAAAEAEEADHRQAHWQAMADQQREASRQREPAEGDAGAEAEPEDGI
jgi:hypothetical protein